MPYLEGVTLEEMLRAARTAARIASSGRAGKPCGADGENHSPESLCRGYSLGRCGRKREDSLFGETE